MKKNAIKLITLLVVANSGAVYAKDINLNFNNDFTVKVNARMQLEAAAFDGVMNAQTPDVKDAGTMSSDFYNRRTWLAFSSDLGDDWSTKIQFDLRDSGDPVRYNELSVSYKGFGPMAKVTVGKLKEPSTYADYASSKHHAFNELAAYVSAWDTGRNYGAMLSGTDNRFNYAAGIFDNGNEDSGKQLLAFAGRASYDFINTDTQLVHFGGIFSHRGSERTSWNQRLGSSKSDRLKIGFDKAESETLYGLELFGKNGSFHYQTEIMQVDISAEGNGRDTRGTGFYGQVGYILTGETRPYKNGFWNGVKPKSSSGAWEVEARYEFMDTTDAKITQNSSGDMTYFAGGVKSDMTTIGLNYYMKSNIRISLDYIYATVDQKINGEDSGNAASLKLWTYF